ncbi:Hypothetical predicted protein [Pelobates cultripes]|uniref:Reverse transcriptase domain-containing protein n=1 Tax=Pelobates cultripes TaxID=61616 RepID=A0AAD1TN57_PELCU|nr:Hypothetical predicted protein [Pelobates cultripes]
MGKSRDLFKKIGDLKVTFHAKVGVIKDENGRDLTEDDQIKKRWQDYTDGRINSSDDLNSWSNELEPETLKSEVRWALACLADNKAAGVDEIPIELFNILLDAAVKFLLALCQQIWKTQQWPRLEKAGLNESEAGINIAGRNINNLRYADDITLAESEEELKDLLMRVKEESAKAGLLHNVKKTKIMANSNLCSWHIDGEEVESVTGFIFLGSKISSDGDCSYEIKSRLLLGRRGTASLVKLVKIKDTINKGLHSQLWYSQ